MFARHKNHFLELVWLNDWQTENEWRKKGRDPISFVCTQIGKIYGFLMWIFPVDRQTMSSEHFLNSYSFGTEHFLLLFVCINWCMCLRCLSIYMHLNRQMKWFIKISPTVWNGNYIYGNRLKSKRYIFNLYTVCVQCTFILSRYGILFMFSFVVFFFVSISWYRNSDVSFFELVISLSLPLWHSES